MSRREKQQMRKRNLIILAVLVLLVAGSSLYLHWNKLSADKTKSVVEQERYEWQQKAAGLEKDAEALNNRIKSRSEEEETPGPGAERQPPANDQADEPDNKFLPRENRCQVLNKKISHFFNYLDGREYIAAYKLKGGSAEHFTYLVNKLFANPPVVARETDNLFTILQNTAYFFRVLGAKDVNLIRNILANEADILESDIALFYQWSDIDDCGEQSIAPRLPLKDLYEYACFFLNTLGGQSYLFRRSSSIRLLTRYYCILILDRANKKIMNRYGVDIRYHINSLLKEMADSQVLTYRQEYVERLQALRDEYASQYGSPKALPEPKAP